ncbi:MAG: leucine ABC transporter subunit substrate-binding protein LivK, partial [Marinobacter sp.]
MNISAKKLATAISASVALMAAGQATADIKIGIAGPMTG